MNDIATAEHKVLSSFRILITTVELLTAFDFLTIFAITGGRVLEVDTIFDTSCIYRQDKSLERQRYRRGTPILGTPQLNASKQYNRLEIRMP